MENFSLLTPLGYQFSSCGYCKGADRSPSYYCHGYRDMRPEHYEILANRMWRRSGTTYYKPDSKNACCPHYSIRLDSSNFRISRNQKKVCNRFTSYITGQDYLRKAKIEWPKSRDEKKKRRGAFDICSRIRDSEWELLPRREGEVNLDDIVPAHKLEVTLEPDAFTEEKYDLFEQYQRLIHKEPPSRISKSGFKRFLCSGMSRSMYVDGARERQIGSYHQCYRIDGKLVAVGVLDLLPHCVSSVYLIYHADFSQWEFGKVSALREIAMARESGYRYYYMGYYIHSCTKMRYKRSFKPTYVLDPESYEWILFDNALLERFDKRRYVSLEREHRLNLAPADPDPEEVVTDPPQTSAHDGLSVFKAGMTGLPSPEQIVAHLRLSDLPFFYRNKVVSVPSMAWSENEMCEPYSLMGRLAEFIACVGIQNVATDAEGGLLAALDWVKEEEEKDDNEIEEE